MRVAQANNDARGRKECRNLVVMVLLCLIALLILIKASLGPGLSLYEREMAYWWPLPPAANISQCEPVASLRDHLISTFGLGFILAQCCGIHSSAAHGEGKGCRESLCGIYHPAGKDDDPVNHSMFIGASGEPVEQIPLSCQAILETDQIGNRSGANQCSEWCNAQLGATPSMFGSISCSIEAAMSKKAPLKVSARAQLVCGKIWFPSQLAKFRSDLAITRLPLIAGMLYGVPGIVWAWFTRLSRSPGEHGLARDNDPLLHFDPRRDGSPALKSWLSPQSPYKSFYYAPFKMLPIKGDYGLSQGLLWSKVFTIATEPVLDITSVVSYAVQGQPWYAALTAASVIWARDPFQVRGHSLMLQALEDGFESEAFYNHQQREGLTEGPIGGFIALWSFLLADPTTIDATTAGIRAASVLQSILVTMPAAVVSSRVLRYIKAGVDPRAFYEIARIKSSIGIGLKWLPTALMIVTGTGTVIFRDHTAYQSGLVAAYLAFIVLNNKRMNRTRRVHLGHEASIGRAIAGALLAIVFLIIALAAVGCVVTWDSQHSWYTLVRRADEARRQGYFAGFLQLLFLGLSPLSLIATPILVRLYFNDLQDEAHGKMQALVQRWRLSPDVPGRYTLQLGRRSYTDTTWKHQISDNLYDTFQVGKEYDIVDIEVNLVDERIMGQTEGTSGGEPVLFWIPIRQLDNDEQFMTPAISRT